MTDRKRRPWAATCSAPGESPGGGDHRRDRVPEEGHPFGGGWRGSTVARRAGWRTARWGAFWPTRGDTLLSRNSICPRDGPTSRRGSRASAWRRTRPLPPSRNWLPTAAGPGAGRRRVAGLGRGRHGLRPLGKLRSWLEGPGPGLSVGGAGARRVPGRPVRVCGGGGVCGAGRGRLAAAQCGAGQQRRTGGTTGSAWCWPRRRTRTRTTTGTVSISLILVSGWQGTRGP